MGKFKGKSNIEPFSHRAPLLGIQYASSENFTYFESTKVAYNQLLEALKDDSICKIGVYGMGGCGKTTLVTQVGKKAEELNLFNKVISITVSQAPDIRGIQGKMADMLSMKLEEESNGGRAQRLWMCLKEKKRVLIIVDDVWGDFDLSDIGIRLSENYKGTLKILITTRRSEVCNSMDCQKSIPLGLLTEDESWTLFQSRANIDDGFCKSFNGVPRKLCNECKGLPIAIVSVASSLKGKKHKAEWGVALNSLKNSEAIDDHVEEGVRDAFRALKLSYDYLENQEAKVLFSMCSLFPEDHEIKIEDMIRYAVGLGLGGRFSLESARNRIEAGINKLISSCLLMQDEEKEEYVKLHDLVRDVALWIGKTSNDHKVLVNFKRPLSTLVGDGNTRNVFGVSSWYHEDQISLQWDAPNLEILLLNNMDTRLGSMDISESTFEGIKGLKVLSIIRKSYIEPFSMPHSIRSLTNLQTLRLKGWRLGDISFILYMTKLEVLDLGYCFFNRLPDDLGKELKRLKLLALVGCCVEEEYNGVIGKCEELEELYFVHCYPDQYYSKSLGDIVSLSKLERLVIHERSDRFPHTDSYLITGARRILELADTNISKIGASKRNTLQTAEFVIMKKLHGGCRNIIPDMIGGMKDLRVLHLEWCKEIECIIDTTASASQQDQLVALIPKFAELELQYLDNLTELFRVAPPQLEQVLHLFEKLEKLVIWHCPRLQSIFPSELCSLGNLRILNIDGGGYCRLVGESLFSMPVAQSLARLEELSVSGCDELKHVIASESKEIVSTHYSMMPNLKILHIDSCNKLEYVFPICCVVEGFARLQHITITDAPEIEYVFGECDHHSCHQYENENQVILHFPQLECLSLEDLESLVGLCPEKYNVKWTSQISQLRVWICPRLTTSWIAMMFSSEQIHHHMDHLSKDQEKHLPSDSKLQCVELCGLPNLISCIGLNPTHILSLHCLQHLQVQRCKNLKSLFSIAVYRSSLPELTILKISYCKELEQIIEENDDELEHISNTQVLFPKLTYVTVEDCNKLRSLFSIAIVRMLPKLSTLLMNRGDQLETVFRHGSSEDVTTTIGTEIVLPNLTKIQLITLPNFVDICHGYKLHAVKLRTLRIFECPKVAPSLREIEEQLRQ